MFLTNSLGNSSKSPSFGAIPGPRLPVKRLFFNQIAENDSD